MFTILVLLTLINYRTNETKRNETRKTLQNYIYNIHDICVGVFWYARRNSHY